VLRAARKLALTSNRAIRSNSIVVVFGLVVHEDGQLATHLKYKWYKFLGLCPHLFSLSETSAAQQTGFRPLKTGFKEYSSESDSPGKWFMWCLAW
jgi:hypothetical protein